MSLFLIVPVEVELTAPAKVKFVIEPRARLVCERREFSSQEKTFDEIISPRLQGVMAMQELMNDRNLALFLSGTVFRQEVIMTLP